MQTHRTDDRAGLAHVARAGELAEGEEAEPTITATLDDGPLQGSSIEARLVQGRPPSTVDAPAEDGSTCRYCLAELNQAGPTASYTYLYRV